MASKGPYRVERSKVDHNIDWYSVGSEYSTNDRGEAKIVCEMMNAAFAAGVASVGKWQPIESAPKDGTRILLGYSTHIFTGVWAVCGEWDDERYTKLRRGYWKHEMHFAGVLAMRSNPPTHWQPLPEPPDTTAARERGQERGVGR